MKRKAKPVARGTLALGRSSEGAPWWFVSVGGCRTPWRALAIGYDPRGKTWLEVIPQLRGVLSTRDLRQFHACIRREEVVGV